jgi:type IV secretory pathway TrbL component
MKQRSALMVAAGLVLALAIAGFGLATGMTGPSADAKAVHPDQRKPVVHTTTRTVPIHQKGEATTGSAARATTTASSTTSTASSGSSESGSDDSYEHESETDDVSGSSDDATEAQLEGGDD